MKFNRNHARELAFPFAHHVSVICSRGMLSAGLCCVFDDDK